MTIRFRLLTLLALPLLVLGGLFAIDMYPKSEPLPFGGGFKGWYRGLGLAYGPGFFGKRFYRIEYYPTYEQDGVSFFYLDKNTTGYCDFRGWYPNGNLREEGKCLVEFLHNAPCPDPHVVLQADYISPDGSKRTSIVDGSGVQSFWNSKGTLVWEMKTEKLKRKRVRLWKDDGTLITDKVY